MGYKHDKDEILTAAVDAVLDEGISNLTFGRLAKRIGVADRSIVYYFPTKADLVTSAAVAIGARFQVILDEAFGDAPLTRIELARRAWPVLASPEADPVFSVFFELVGLGGAAVAPFDDLGPMLMESWIDWLLPRIDSGDADARAVAYATVATIDGLLLLRHTCGPDAAHVAAAELGIAD